LITIHDRLVNLAVVAGDRIAAERLYHAALTIREGVATVQYIATSAPVTAALRDHRG
jgi:hypothetical protein